MVPALWPVNVAVNGLPEQTLPPVKEPPTGNVATKTLCVVLWLPTVYLISTAPLSPAGSNMLPVTPVPLQPPPASLPMSYSTAFTHNVGLPTRVSLMNRIGTVVVTTVKIHEVEFVLMVSKAVNGPAPARAAPTPSFAEVEFDRQRITTLPPAGIVSLKPRTTLAPAPPLKCALSP